MRRAPKLYPQLAGQSRKGAVRARHSEARAIVDCTNESFVIDVPTDLSHHLSIGCPIVLSFDDLGALDSWRVSARR